jgi:lipoyl(octanoyl) transferase
VSDHPVADMDASPARLGDVAGPGGEPAQPLRCDWLGRVDYVPTWRLQLALRDALLDGHGEPRVLLCEHPPVITLGRSARPDNILATAEALAAAGVAVHAIERGGDVTYHGPGQLMIYPILPIRSVVAFLAAVGGVLAETCAALGVPGATFRTDPAGLWLGDHKLAACGINLRRGVSVHGWAVNLATPAAQWRLIRPCGGDSPQRSLSEARTLGGWPPLDEDGDVAAVAAAVIPRLQVALPPVMRAVMK